MRSIKREQGLKERSEVKSWAMKTNNFLVLSQKIISMAKQSEIMHEYTTLNDDFTKRLKDENCKQDEREVGEKRPMLKSPSVHHRENRKSRREKRRQEDKDKEERRIWKLASYNLSHVISRKNFSDKKRCKFLARRNNKR